MNNDSIYPIFYGFKKIIQEINDQKEIINIFNFLKVYARNKLEVDLMKSLLIINENKNTFSVTKFISEIKNLYKKNPEESIKICNNIINNIDDTTQLSVLEVLIYNIRKK